LTIKHLVNSPLLKKYSPSIIVALFGHFPNLNNFLIRCTKFYLQFEGVISLRSVLLVEDTEVPAESHRPVASHWQTLSHNVAQSTPCHERDSNSQR